MKRKFIILSLIMLLAVTIFAACSNNENNSSSKEKSFTISCPTEMIAGERVEITIKKSYDFEMYHKDYQWEIIGENTVGGSFEFEKLDSHSNYTNKFFRAIYPGQVSIRAKNTTSGELISNTVTITVTAETISTIGELKALADTNRTVALGADIDLTGEEWVPINGFKGTLIGAGHKIKNLTLTAVNQPNIGLFGVLEGTVRGLIVENALVNVKGDAGNAGILAGTNKGRIESADVSGSIEAKYYNNVGGIVGVNESGIIKDSVNRTAVNGADNVGGVVGKAVVNQNNAIDGNSNEGTIVGKEKVGGIAGYVTCVRSNATYEVANNENKGEVTGDSQVGGIFGEVYAFYERYNYDNYNSYFSMSVLTNSAEVNGSPTGHDTGGLIGKASRLTLLTTCENTADITGGICVGGFVGYAPDTNIKAIGAENNNTISGDTYVGGFAGQAGVVEDAINNGIVNASSVGAAGEIYLGGVVGYCTGIIGCINNADIEVIQSGKCVGGIAGYIYLSNTDCVRDNSNNANIKAGQCDDVGGIVGYVTCIRSNATYKITDNVNSGKVTGHNEVGGITGYVYAFYERYNYDNYNSYFEIVNCSNEAEIVGNSKVGGICGGYERLKTDANLMDTNTTAYGDLLGQ